MAAFSLLSTADVAARKGCTRMAVRNAIHRGEINAFRVGRTWAVAADEALDTWEVRETGGRAHRQRAADGVTEAGRLDVSADTLGTGS